LRRVRAPTESWKQPWSGRRKRERQCKDGKMRGESGEKEANKEV
jgi:hypothetical protein